MGLFVREIWAQSGRNANYDRRAAAVTIGRSPQLLQQSAIETMSGDLSGSLTYGVDPATGVTATLRNPVGYLTEPAGGDPVDVAVDFVRSHTSLLGLATSDLAEYEITDTVYSTVTGATHIYLRQRHLGLPIYNAQLQVHVNRDGRIAGINNAFVPGLANLGKSATPRTRAVDALTSAGRHLGVPMTRAPRRLAQQAGASRRTRLEASVLSSGAVDATLMWLPVGAGLQLVWNFQLDTPDGQHIYDMTVDAEGGAMALDDGARVMTRFDWVSAGQYRVYEQPVESPIHTSPGPPSDARVLVVNPEDSTASPQGWFHSGTTIMDGNNVHAYLDRNGNNAPDSGQPSCGGSLICDFPINLSADPINSTDAAIANLFYWNNVVHDIQYQYGFDEQGGNFQENNFGLGGNGSDSVNAEAQDNAGGSSRCNANFATPSDGFNPRMQMFVCNNTSPQRDGDFDNGVIVHEYGHGISIRQVGGPGNSSCLNNNQQGGEGWSDWLALVYTAEPGDQPGDARGVGSYLFGLAPNGSIRPQQYSTNPAINNYTYESINGLSIPHGVGSVWAQALWEVYWALVGVHGFDANLYNANGGAGNQRAMLYVNEGLKNTACSPTFVAARDGVIQAANDVFGGEDVCLLWETFAAFGLGVNAISGGSNSTNPTNGFDIPQACQAPPPPPPPPPTGSFEAHFDVDDEGFRYQDDAFRGTNAPAYASGAYSAGGGFSGGGLGVTLGGIDGADINGMSGGWERQFNLTQAQNVSISVRYNLTLAANYESNELGQALLSIDGSLVGVGSNDYLAQIAGDGNGGSPTTTGWVQVDLDLGTLSSGLHTLVVGGFNNLKTFDDESTTVFIDDVVVTAGGGPPPPPPNTAPSVSITAPSDGATFTEGTTINFTGAASDAEDGDISGTIDWSSSPGGSLGTGASVSTSSLAPGSYTVTADVTDSGGLGASDTIDITVTPVGGGCTDCVDWNVTTTVAYSNQDSTGTIEVRDNGDTFFLEGNRWRRTTQTFNVTPFTVVEFEFMSTSQGEIHGIGFDEDDTLNNNTRIFEIFGTQNWSNAFQVSDKYTTSDLGTFRTFRIEVGQFYTGNGLFLVLVNDKDSGALNNTSSFRNVRVFEDVPPPPPPPPGCGTVLHVTDFESGTNGWTHDASASTCSTGVWGLGDPDGVVNGGVTTQLEDDHTVAGVNAFFTEPNGGGAGTNDVDNGVCSATSPIIDASTVANARVTLWYYHGQRDAGDDGSGDFFRIDVSNNGGATYATNLVSIGDVTSNAAWTEITTTIANPGQLRIRVQASDGAGPGDLVEAGIDDVLVCQVP